MRRLIKHYMDAGLSWHELDKVLPAFGSESRVVGSILVSIAEAAELIGGSVLEFCGTGAEMLLEMLRAESFTFGSETGQNWLCSFVLNIDPTSAV